MRKIWMVIFVVVLLAMPVLACSIPGGKIAAKATEVVATVKSAVTAVKSSETTPAPTATLAKAREATPTPVPTTAKPSAATPTLAKGKEAEEGSLSLQSREAGLDKLKSYRMRWQAEWKSTEAGKTESFSMDWREEYSSSPKALHWVWKIVDAQDKSKSMDWEAWQIGDTTYFQMKDEKGEAQCFSLTSADQKDQLTKGMFDPGMLGSLSDAKYVGTDTVNAIKAKHYRYDEKAAGLAYAGKLTGEIWVAVDGGYVVKETIAWSGAAGLFGESSTAKGDGKWTWELSDIDQAITIKAPEGCAGAAAEIPVMKDATEKATMGDMLTYSSPSKLKDVVAFYKAQMPPLGWKLEGEPEVSDEFAMLEFSKGASKAQIMISVNENKTAVVITVEK